MAVDLAVGRVGHSRGPAGVGVGAAGHRSDQPHDREAAGLAAGRYKVTDHGGRALWSWGGGPVSGGSSGAPTRRTGARLDFDL